MRNIICKDQRAAIEVQRALPDASVIWPCVRQFRCFTAEVIEVMPDIDLDQDVDGMTLAQHIKARQMTFNNPRIEVLSAHDRLKILRDG